MTYHDAPIDATEIERRLKAYLDELVYLAGGPMTVWRAARVVMEHLRWRAQAPPHEPITLPITDPEAIVACVAAAHDLTVADLRGPNRSRPVSAARHHAAWELRVRRPDLPLQKIAAWLDRVDHATVINSLKKFSQAIVAGQYAKERAHVERALS